MRAKPYLQLVRLPNLFTAMADSLAGWLIVGGRLDDLAHWPWLVVASLCLYAGGVVLNDVFDRRIDQLERPQRPIPSGRVSGRVAAALGALLLALGLGAAWLAATRLGLVIALLIILGVLAYDAGLKSTWAGPEIMGACRSLNLLLGMSQADQLGGPAAWVVALAHGTFVTGITWISRSEVFPGGSSRGIAAGILLQNSALLLLLAVSVHAELLPNGPAEWMARTTAGVLVLMGVAIALNRRTLAAISATEGQTVQRAVKAGIFALVWLHVGVILAARGPVEALSVGWLWFPAYFTGRWVYST